MLPGGTLVKFDSIAALSLPRYVSTSPKNTKRRCISKILIERLCTLLGLPISSI